MRYCAISMFLIAGGLAGCGESGVDAPIVDLSGVLMEIHIAPGCSCCARWASYLRNSGADVTVAEETNLEGFKSAAGVPEAARSCHTGLVDGYVIEGHVPAEAITRFLDEAPVAVGIAVAGMPTESPGMGGGMREWRSLDVLLIGRDGDLSRYPWLD